MKKDLYVGIDAGSTVCKAGLFDEHGTELVVFRRTTPLSRPRPGWVEADPDIAIGVLFDLLEQVAGATKSFGNIQAIGLTGAMVGAWFVDRTGTALRPGINWEDSRSQPFIDRKAMERPGFHSEVFNSSGSVLQQGCTLPILAWFAENEPTILDRARWVLSYKDFLRFVLTGVAATDQSEAAVIPGDARTQDRSSEMLTLFGINEHACLLPPVAKSDEQIGSLTSSAAARCGLPPGIPVVAGAGDVIANIIGAGGLKAGAATAMFGTTGIVGISHDRPVFDPPDIGLLFSLPEKLWYRAMVNVAATMNLDWAVDMLFPEIANLPDRYERINQVVAAHPIGANGVIYLPYLSESGIIAPIVSSTARAQFCGLAPQHTRKDLIRAVFEGVAFAFADLADLLDMPDSVPLVVTGGGGRSPVWRGMIASLLERELLAPEGQEFGARGVALLAAKSQGRYGTVGEASKKNLKVDFRTRPDITLKSQWDDARCRFTSYRDLCLGGG